MLTCDKARQYRVAFVSGFATRRLLTSKSLAEKDHDLG